MKNRFFCLLFILAGSFLGNAQVNPHAIGVRGLFGNYGSGGEISYQHGMGDMNRLELDLGWRSSRYGWRYKKKDKYYRNNLGITGVYHWVWNIEDGFNWFAGVGGQLGYFSSYDEDYYREGLALALGGQVGIEFDFNSIGAPLQLGLDARPMWEFIGGPNTIGYGIALSLRYTF